MLKNPVYTGRTVWNRLDFTEAKHAGGGARRRAREEWVIADDAHLAIVEDALFEAAQKRFTTRARGNGSAHAKRTYVLSGRVRCCSGHGPRSMQGKTRKGHTYYTCEYAASYGPEAALEVHDGLKVISAREDRLLKLVLRFFEQRIFGPLRLERLEKQLRAQARRERTNGKLAGTRLRQQLAEIDRKIKAQVIALEDGVEPELVTERILGAAGREGGTGRGFGRDWSRARGGRRRGAFPPAGPGPRPDEVAGRCNTRGPASGLRGLRSADRLRQSRAADRDSATISEAVANAFENTKALQKEGSVVVAREIAGAGFEPATFGL